MLSKNNKLFDAFNNFFNEKEQYSKKELIEFAKKAYDDNYKNLKKKNDENKEKKPLNAYQLFMREQRIILNKRENERTNGEKKKSTELMKEIAELWKSQKIRIETNKVKEMFVNEELEKEKKDIKNSSDEEEQESTIIQIKNKKKSSSVKSKEIVKKNEEKEKNDIEEQENKLVKNILNIKLKKLENKKE